MFVPFKQHPCACIPCPLGHVRVARHEGAFGFLQPPTYDSVAGWHDAAVSAWEQADEHSTSSEERRLMALLPPFRPLNCRRPFTNMMLPLLRLLLRSALVPWFDGWTRDLDGLDLSLALKAHFCDAPCPSLLPSAFWLFTHGSAGKHKAGCGVVLCVEHGFGQDSFWSLLGWSHSCPDGATNNEAERSAILHAAT